MISYAKVAIFVILTSFVPLHRVAAIDFDSDGLSDFVLIDINSNSKLEWFAIDTNDTARRALGVFGSSGNHLAVGNWSGDNITSKAFISKEGSEFEWDIDLPSGTRKLKFGTLPSKIVSGLDFDNNGAIDPAVVTVGRSALEWKMLSNPGLVASPAQVDKKFGSKGNIPFFANIDGSGDQIGSASVSKAKVLTVRLKHVTTGRVKTFTVKNFKSPVTSVLPVRGKSGTDLLFVVSSEGTKHTLTLINPKKRTRKTSVTSDSEGVLLVGSYLGGSSQVVAVRKNATEVVLVNANAKRITVPLALDGIPVDDININSFSDADVPTNPQSPPGSTRSNPPCSGTMISTDHMLYKPVSDTSGMAVIVTDSKYQREFLSVQIQLKDGTFAQGFWTGLKLWGNPDSGGMRQHWRTNVTHRSVADKALIIANDGKQECRFILPGSSSRRWE